MTQDFQTIQTLQPPTANTNASTRALVTLIFGILSLVCCGFFMGIPAIFLGKSEIALIDQGKSPASGRNLAKIGLILGIIGTCLSLLMILFYAAMLILGLSLGAFNQGSFQ